MIGISFRPFLALLILGFIAAFVLHVVVRYRMLSRFDGFMVKWIAGWIGAWLGSPVFGHWGLGFNIGNVYIIPALLGAFALAFLITAAMKAEAVAVAKATMVPQTTGLAVEMRKAS
jgi:uncharacterized membrane protein YeaQ/YmgE (transglycosylase-associated protein family)